MPGSTLARGRGGGDHEAMRHESCVTSLSWIPSEAVTGGTRVAFDAGFTHYDDPPPGELGDIEELRGADRFRFANVLRAWIDVDDSGRITLQIGELDCLEPVMQAGQVDGCGAHQASAVVTGASDPA